MRGTDRFMKGDGSMRGDKAISIWALLLRLISLSWLNLVMLNRTRPWSVGRRSGFPWLLNHTDGDELNPRPGHWITQIDWMFLRSWLCIGLILIRWSLKPWGVARLSPEMIVKPWTFAGCHVFLGFTNLFSYDFLSVCRYVWLSIWSLYRPWSLFLSLTFPYLMA